MKKIFGMVGVMIVMFSLCGCSFQSGTNVRTRQLDKENQTEMERIYEVENTLIEAMENKDEELLKSLFSEKALSRAGDIEKGIDYMFNLYQGEFVEIVERNHSSDAHIEENKNTKDIAAWCIIKTTENVYKVSWVDWQIQQADPTAVGLYNMQMREYKEGDYRSYYDIAGINYPEREYIHSTIEEIHNVLENKDISYLMPFLSKTILSRVENITVYGDKLFDLFPHYIYSDIDDGWITYSEINGVLRQNVFLEIRGNNENYIMYFCYDAVETDKISILKFTQVEEGKPLSEYELGDTYTQSGIYLP